MASFPLHWPSAAHGGYVGPVCDVAHDYAADRHVRHWQELIDHTSSMGTQVYAHIVRRTVWTRYWDGRSEESHVGAYRALRTGEGGHDAVQVLHASLALGGRYPELVSAVIAAIQSPHAPLVPELVEAVRDALLALQPQRTAA